MSPAAAFMNVLGNVHGFPRDVTRREVEIFFREYYGTVPRG